MLLQPAAMDPLDTGVPKRGQALAQFLQSVQSSLQQTHDVPSWVEAELAFVQGKQRLWSLGLQETNAQGQKLAATEAVVWERDVPNVIHKFKEATGQELEAGLKVLLQVQVQFSPQWGFRLICRDIAPQWTLGEAAVHKYRVRQTLVDEGLWQRNQGLPEPMDFTHVAVVAPHASAGLEDFLRESQRLEQLGLCRFTVFHAPFEGTNAPIQLPQALQQASQLPGVDAVCLIRGGGAASGIAWLDQEAIVRAAAKCSVPLITGIGHERDTPLVEELAMLASGTPSKAIALIVARITQRAAQAQRAWLTIQQQAQERLAQAQQRLERQRHDAQHQTQRLIGQARQAVDALAREALGLGPQSTLQRGYALVTDTNGALLTHAPQAPNTLARVRFQDGQVPVVFNPIPAPSIRPRKSQTKKATHE